MSYVSLAGAVVTGGLTYVAIRNTPIPTAGKVGIAIVASGAGYFATRAIEKAVTGGGSSGQRGALKLNQTEAQEILKNNAYLPPGEQVTASHTKADYATYANDLETAMSGLGTNNDEVKRVITEAINNDLDFIYLVDAFGIRDDDDLATWLDDDGAKEYSNDILKTKANVSKRF